MPETSLPPRDLRRRAVDARLRVRRVVLARRRSLAAVLTFAAVAAGLHAARPPEPVTVPVRVASRDLPAGTVLAADDLAVVEVDPDGLPDGLVAAPESQTLAAPVRRGEPVTDVRLVGPGLTEGHPDLTALPVRLPDPGMVALLHVGDRIDLIATDPRSGPAAAVARDALVLALPGDGAGDAATGADVAAAGLGGRLVVLGVAESDVTRLAAAGVRAFLTFTFVGGRH